MRRVRAVGVMSLVLSLTGAPPTWADETREPSFLHGLGQVIAGLVFELPKTTLDATLTNPPVLGTMVGLLAGTMNELRMIGEGLQEMAVGFNPWNISRRHR